MPEGPEVKRCGDIIEKFVGQKIKAVSLSEKGKFQTIQSDLIDGTKLDEVFVKGKIIQLKLDSGNVAESTLGMAGWWYPPIDQLDDSIKDRKVYYLGKMVTAGEIIRKALKQARFKLIFDEGELIYCDQRNFGNFKVTSADKSKIKTLGVDVMTEAYTYDYPATAIRARIDAYRKKHSTTTIADMLLDQSVFCGIGNIYRAESLYISGVYPLRLISEMTIEEIHHVYFTACYVLNIAYQTESSMVYDKDFLERRLKNQNLRNRLNEASVDKIPGHLVYGRSVDIFGHRVVNLTHSGRTLWYVPEVQSLE